MFDKDGNETPLPKLMKLLWTGERDGNLAPIVDSVNIDGFVRYQDIILKHGETHQANVTVNDDNGDSLLFSWEIRPEAIYASYAGQGEKEPQPIEGLIADQGPKISFTTPSEIGAYRLFVYVFDGQKQFSTANLPFLVE